MMGVIAAMIVVAAVGEAAANSGQLKNRMT